LFGVCNEGKKGALVDANTGILPDMSHPDSFTRDLPFRVGEWLVDPLNNQLQLGESRVKLEPKVMDVLIYLAMHRGKVVSREELEEHVWAGRIVTYDALTATIVKLRKAFQVSNQAEPVIKTISKRGYSLVAPVTSIDPIGEADSASKAPEQAAVPTPVTPVTKDKAQHEHRQVTVLACELIDFATLTARLDTDDLHDVLQQFQSTCANVVQRFAGYVGQYLNGSLVIYFGYPEAHEDGAERAVRTALGVQEAMQKLTVQFPALQALLRIRIGIHTGQVVVGEIADGDLHERMSVVGDTPTIANALQNMAEPGHVLIGESTQQLVENRFVFSPQRPLQLKGRSPPIRVYRVQGLQPLPERFEAKQLGSLTPLIGRDAEIDLLLKRWQQSCAGESQVVMLCADAGIGKSRILHGLQERLQDQRHHHLGFFCSPYHTNSSLYPVITALERTLGIQLNNNPDESLDKLEAYLDALGIDVADNAPVFAELLSLPTTQRYSDFKPRPQELKTRTLSCLLNLLQRMAEQQPLLLMLEDTHWADPTTLEFIDLAITELGGQRLLIVASYRPEYDPPWSAYHQATLLRLNRLSQQESNAIITNLTGGKTLPADILQQIIARADGVPLYVEELTKSILASDALKVSGQQMVLKGALRPLTVPASLHDSLMARLDQLKLSKPLAQLAATLGRSFSRDLLRAVADEDEHSFEAAINELLRAELIFRRGVPPDVSYEFKHALVQNAAYQSLLKRTRQQFHEKIARVLENQFNQIAKAQPEVIAHHYTEAQHVEAAIDYWLRAAQRASERSANLEAIAHVNKGLELHALLSEEPRRNELELKLLLVLGPALLSAKGLGARDAEQVYLRARELCHEEGQREELFTVTWGLWMLCQKRGRLHEAKAFSQELLALADSLADREYQLQAHHAAWTTHFRLSEFAACLEHVQQGMGLYDADAHRHHATRFGGHDPGVCAYYNAAMVQWLFGYADQARASIQQSVRLAEQINHPLSQVLAHVYSAFIAQYCGDPKQVQRHTQKVLSISHSHGIAPDCAAQAGVLDGWMETLSGNLSRGIRMIEQAVMSLRDTGVRTHELYLLSILADSYARAGRVQDGLRVITDALKAIDETGERTFDAEVHRLKGALLLMESENNLEQARNCFQQAIGLAKQQHAKSLELRATMSLCRAQHEHQGQQLTAQMLGPLYKSFNEGRDTADLRAAATLLAQR